MDNNTHISIYAIVFMIGLYFTKINNKPYTIRHFLVYLIVLISLYYLPKMLGTTGRIIAYILVGILIVEVAFIVAKEFGIGTTMGGSRKRMGLFF